MAGDDRSLRSEPFRLFFPLASVLGAAGVVHWVLFTTGAISQYLARFHAVTQTQAFLMAFAAGFLLTAVPKRTQSPPASWAEIGLLMVLFPAVSLLTLYGADRLGQAAYAASLLVMGQFAIRRFLARASGRRPPASFVLVPLGFMAALAGAALTVIGLSEGAPLWALSLGRRLTYQGLFLCLTLGIGAFFLPLAGSGQAAPDLRPGNRRAALGFAAAGLAILAGLALEVRGPERLGPLIRGVAAVIVIFASGAWRLPSRPGANRRLLWISLWAIPLGQLAAAAFPEERIEALHITFIGGFGLLAFAVGTHVGLGHAGHDAAQAGRPWPIIAFGALFLIAMVMRVTALLVPSIYFGWLGAAAALWLLACVIWAIYLLPKILRAPDGPPPPGAPRP